MKHNKKRNIGLVYEFLTRAMAGSLLAGDDGRFDAAASIVFEHLRPGTALNDEFILFNALIRTRGVDDIFASRILGEVKARVAEMDHDAIEREKTTLLSNMSAVGLDDIFEIKIPNYRELATVGTLFDAWRDSKKLTPSMIQRERDVVSQMKEDALPEMPIELCEMNDLDRLALRLMEKKIDERYHELDDVQRRIVRRYIFSDDDGAQLREFLNTLRRDAVKGLNRVRILSEEAGIDETKINEVSKRLSELDTTVIDDTLIERFLVVAELAREIGAL